MLPFVHSTYVFPYELCPHQLVRKTKPSSQRGEKHVLFSSKTINNPPQLPSCYYEQRYVVPPPNKNQIPQGSNT